MLLWSSLADKIKFFNQISVGFTVIEVACKTAVMFSAIVPETSWTDSAKTRRRISIIVEVALTTDLQLRDVFSLTSS
jgi:hypothetical protein